MSVLDYVMLFKRMHRHLFWENIALCNWSGILAHIIVIYDILKWSSLHSYNRFYVLTSLLEKLPLCIQDILAWYQVSRNVCSKLN